MRHGGWPAGDDRRVPSWGMLVALQHGVHWHESCVLQHWCSVRSTGVALPVCVAGAFSPFHPRCLTFLAGCVAPTPELGVCQGLSRPDQRAPTCSGRPSAQPTASTRSLGPGHAVAAPHDPLGTLQAVMQASPFAGAGLGPFEDAAPHPAGPLDAYRHGSSSGRDARCVQGAPGCARRLQPSGGAAAACVGRRPATR